ncbi:MAG TPA: cytochrome c biogenesis protein ResB [Gemmataceae bacterium]|jgi:hypothetical protein
MNNASTQITTAPAPPVAAMPLQPARRGDRLKPLKKLLKPFASLRLTVVLFVLSIILIFCGTLAQMDNGLWAILHGYFRTWLAWIPFQVFVRFGQVFFWFPKTWQVSGSFPFPGGYIIGGALLVNLVAAHLVRFRISWKRSGILLIHAGLIVLMLGELVTGLFAVEGMMVIVTGESSNYVIHTDKPELAVIDSSDRKTDHVVVVPGSMLKLRQGSEWIRDEQLPFDIEVNRYMVNSAEPRKVKADEKNLATAGAGVEGVVDEEKPGRGTDADQRIDMPAAYVTLRDKGNGSSLGTYLATTWIDEGQTVKVGGKEYQIALRLQREYTPYTLHLEEFRHDLYPGTNTPLNFSSRVRVIDPEHSVDRETLIYMNNPLRYRGATFYQASWIPNDRGTKLQVVTNPGWLMPYFSCAMVALGMTIHFGIHLVSFLRRRTTP